MYDLSLLDLEVFVLFVGAVGLAAGGLILGGLVRASPLDPVEPPPPTSAARRWGWVAFSSVAGAVVLGVGGSLLTGGAGITSARLVLPLLGALGGTAVAALVFATTRSGEEVLRGRRAEAPAYSGRTIAAWAAIAAAMGLGGLSLLILLGGYLAFAGLVPVLPWAAAAALLSVVLVDRLALSARPPQTRVTNLSLLRFSAGQFTDQILAVTAAMTLAYLNPIVYTLYPDAVVFPVFLVAWVAVASFIGLIVGGAATGGSATERLITSMGAACVVALFGLWFFAGAVFGGNLGFWVAPAIGLFTAIALVGLGQSRNLRIGPTVRGVVLHAILFGGLILAYAAVGWNESWKTPSINFDLGVYGVGLWAVALGSMWLSVVAGSIFERVSAAGPDSSVGEPSGGEGGRLAGAGLIAARSTFVAGTTLGTGWLVLWAFLWLSAADYQTSFDHLLASINLGAPVFVLGLATGSGLAIAGVGRALRHWGAPVVPRLGSSLQGAAFLFAACIGVVLVAGWLGGPIAVAGVLLGTLLAVMPLALWVDQERDLGQESREAADDGQNGLEFSAASSLVVRATGAAALLLAAAFTARSLVGIP